MAIHQNIFLLCGIGLMNLSSVLDFRVFSHLGLGVHVRYNPWHELYRIPKFPLSKPAFRNNKDEMKRKTTLKGRLSLAKCPECGRATPYRLKGLELYFKTTILCKRCGTPVQIGKRLDDQLNVDLWEADVLERARNTYDQCKRLLLVK